MKAKAVKDPLPRKEFVSPTIKQTIATVDKHFGRTNLTAPGPRAPISNEENRVACRLDILRIAWKDGFSQAHACSPEQARERCLRTAAYLIGFR